MRYLPSVLFFTIMLISCKKDNIEDTKIDCGCNSKTERVIKDFPAVYTGTGGLLIFDKLEGNITSILVSEICNTDTTLAASSDMKVPDYLVSGNLKTKCLLQSGFGRGRNLLKLNKSES